MKINKKLLSLLGCAGLLLSQAAFAHEPFITAEAVCAEVTNTVVINYKAMSWDSDGSGFPEEERANDQVEVYVNGVLVTTDAFVSPDYEFTGTVPAPSGASPGDVIPVMVVAVGRWGGDGRAGGQSNSVSVTIPEECPNVVSGNGRFTGGGHQIRVDGVRVTRGLTIHCDLLLSNNLEINWNGNRFHTLEHLTTVACTDDPDIIQAPPPAPLDTLIGTGAGRYNNMEGYSIEFTLVDQGEPGREDQMAIYIYETANPGNVILNIPLQELSGGNLQAHYDQPHK